VPVPQPTNSETPPRGRFTSPADVALVARAMLLLWLAGAAAALAANLRSTVAVMDPSEAILPYAMAAFAQLGATLSLVVWTRRVYGNLPGLGATDPRFGPGWAIGGWFVPLLNLWRPKQILDDAWRAADPDLPAVAGRAWRRGPVPWFLHAWWVAMLAGSFTGVVGSVADAVASRGLVAASGIGSGVAGVAAALLGQVLVTRLSRRQEHRAARLAGSPEPGSARSRPWWQVATALALTGGILVGSLGVEFPSATPIASGEESRYVAFGLEIPYPAGDRTSVRGRDGATPDAAGGLFSARHASFTGLEGFAVYWVEHPIAWTLDAGEVGLWLGDLTGIDGLEATPAGTGTVTIVGKAVPYRLFTSEGGFLRPSGAYALAGAWLPACQRSLLFTVFLQNGAAPEDALGRLEHLVAGFRCGPPPRAA